LANTYHWISTLQALGNVNAEITSDAPLTAVFDQGNVRTYVAYLHGPEGKVTFSDGYVLAAKKSGLQQVTKQIK
jgi:hypothetical protein